MSLVIASCERAREAARTLALATTQQKNAALVAIADAVAANTDSILTANARDVSAATATGTDAAIIDRLTLTAERLAAISTAVREVVHLADPVGERIRDYTLPNGLHIEQTRVPMGVVAMIYEARPNVTVDAASLCLKSGNAALLRGSASAISSNTALTDIMRGAVESVGLPADIIQLVPGTEHADVRELITARGLVDVVIPRGGAGLIDMVVNNSTVPVIETGIGNCHIYVDASADLAKAAAIVVNAKAQRYTVCNTAESVLVHRDIAEQFLPLLVRALADVDVTIHGDSAFYAAAKALEVPVEPVTDTDWATEYYSLDIAAGVVDSIDAAIAHIRRWSTGHTEAIVATAPDAISRFTAEIDAAAVMVNASTRFTDGGEFGFGAEIGISTQKLHARGPMGLPELTSYKYVVTGDGHTRH